MNHLPHKTEADMNSTPATPLACGCVPENVHPLHPKLEDLTGQTFGRLTVLHLAGRRYNGRTLWCCICECGKFVWCNRADLYYDSPQSRGCQGRGRTTMAPPPDKKPTRRYRRLTAPLVMRMRLRYAVGDVSHAEVVRTMAPLCNPDTGYRAVTGRSWKNLPIPEPRSK